MSGSATRLSGIRDFVATALILGALGGLCPSAVAQTVTGTLQGTVTDTTSATLPGVTVTIRNVDTGLVREVLTNERGFYNAPFLPIGRYRLTCASTRPSPSTSGSIPPPRKR